MPQCRWNVVVSYGNADISNQNVFIMIPIAFSSDTKMQSNDTMLAGDVGATKTNLAIYKKNGGELVAVREGSFVSQNYASIIDLIHEFLNTDNIPSNIFLGVAGPVVDGKVNITNLAKQVDEHQISVAFHNSHVCLINDLEATAYGLAVLNENDIFELQAGVKESKGNIAIIAPGTGLGEAGLFWDGKCYHPFATEGGHSDFAARTEQDVLLYKYLQNRFGHVSWERLVSGQGIVNLYQFLVEEMKMEAAEGLDYKQVQPTLAARISAAAFNQKIPACVETMSLFFRLLAEEAANLVLKLKATGGVFIGGGIITKVYPFIDKVSFLQVFCAAGRLNSLLKGVPVKIILNEKTALLGAAAYTACAGERTCKLITPSANRFMNAIG